MGQYRDRILPEPGGANAFNWKIQHNVLHHTYTNVQDEDEDISHRGVLRMTPHSKWKSIYRYQHLYAWFLYGLMTIVWMAVKDFERLIRYQKNGLAKKLHHRYKKRMGCIDLHQDDLCKLYFILPSYLHHSHWWQVILGIFVNALYCGVHFSNYISACPRDLRIKFPLPDDDQKLENNWAIHQLRTTTNFGNKSRWFSWYVGGLNFQIEHHPVSKYLSRTLSQHRSDCTEGHT